MTREQYFIYPRDKSGKRTGHTICVLIRDGKIFHGTALCSGTDQFARKTGRILATERAIAAFDVHAEKLAASRGR